MKCSSLSGLNILSISKFLAHATDPRLWQLKITVKERPMLSPTVIKRLKFFCQRVKVDVDLEDRLPRYADDPYTLVGIHSRR